MQRACRQGVRLRDASLRGDSRGRPLSWKSLRVRLRRFRRGFQLERSTAFAAVALVALAVQSFLLFLAFFEPGLPYSVSQPPGVALDSGAYARLLENVAAGRLSSGNRVDVLSNGEAFYPAELDAIRQARESVHLEAYIFS